MTDVRDFARELVLGCGEYLRSLRRQNSFSVMEKTDHSDIVTDHDLFVQQYLSERILKKYPDHGVIGEENMCREGTSPWKWVIDPIDGTTNYCQFGKDYAVSAALLYQGKPAYGFVLDVEKERLYEGDVLAEAKNKCPGENNDAPKTDSCNIHESAQDGILHIGFKTMRDFNLGGADPYALMERFRGVRYLGCASLELCGITDESAGVYINSHLKLWDFAAAYAVLKENGCHMAAAELSDGNYFVCAYRSPLLIRQCFPFFPEMVRQKLIENGGDIFHAKS